MRRSRSSSNIPLATFRRTLSSENLRSLQPGLKRTNSSNNLAPPRPSARSSVRKNEPRNSHLITPVTSRRTTATPLRSGPMSVRLTSPGLQLTTQKINDKKYSADQYRKVCEFLSRKNDNFDPKSLKSLTMNSFVDVLTLLFNEIDPRIKINMANHKEIVMKYLKLYKYPGSVTLSMLKSAHTSLSWAPVMSIFGWLVDLINRSNEEGKDDYLTSHMTACFKACCQRNVPMDQNPKPVDFINELTGVNKEMIDHLNITLKEAQAQRDKLKKKNRELKMEETSLKERLDKMKSDIEEVKERKEELKLETEIQQLTAANKLKDLEIIEKRSAINNVKNVIANQKYNVNDFQALLNELEDKKYSLNLKQQTMENALKLKYESDTKLTDLRREVENKVHAINSCLLKLNTRLVDVKVQFPDTGFHQPNFIQIIEEKKEQLRNIESNSAIRIKNAKEVLSSLQKEREILQNDLDKMSEKNAVLNSNMERIKAEKERIMFEALAEQKLLEKKIECFPEVDIEKLEKELNEAYNRLSEADKKKEEYKAASVKFFKRLSEETIVTRNKMMNIMEDILNSAKEALEAARAKKQSLLSEMEQLNLD